MVSDAGASRHGTERQGYLRARGGERGRAGGRVHLQALHRGQRGSLVALQLLHGDHAVLQRGHLAAARAPVCSWRGTRPVASTAAPPCRSPASLLVCPKVPMHV